MPEWQEVIYSPTATKEVTLPSPIIHLKGFHIGCNFNNSVASDSFLHALLHSGSQAPNAPSTGTICWDGDNWSQKSFSSFIVQAAKRVGSDNGSLVLCAFVSEERKLKFLQSWSTKQLPSLPQVKKFVVLFPTNTSSFDLSVLGFKFSQANKSICWGGGDAIVSEVQALKDVQFSIWPVTRTKNGKTQGVDLKRIGSFSNVSVVSLPAPDTPQLSSQLMQASPKASLTPRKNFLCLTLHQPWASMMVYGLKRCEGRVWQWPKDIPVNQELWIHAASRVPEPSEIEQVEQQYKTVFEGLPIEFPRAYPTSCLLGCVTMVRCVSSAMLNEEFKDHPDPATRAAVLESSSPYIFLCKDARRLVLPISMGGSHKLWKVPREQASQFEKQLKPMKSPSSLPI